MLKKRVLDMVSLSLSVKGLETAFMPSSFIIAVIWRFLNLFLPSFLTETYNKISSPGAAYSGSGMMLEIRSSSERMFLLIISSSIYSPGVQL